MLRRKISVSKQLARLSTDRARLLFTWMLTHLDVEGRMTGDGEIVKALVAPLLKTMTAETVEQDLEECAATGLIQIYDLNGERFVQFPGFIRNQNLRSNREAKSQIPAPPEQFCGSTPGLLQESARSTPAEVKEGREGKVRRGSGFANKTLLPSGFELTSSRREYAEKKGAKGRGLAPERVADVFEAFLDYHQQHGSRFADWDAAWRTWARREHADSPHEAGSPDSTWNGRQVWECDNPSCTAGGVHESPNKDRVPANRRCPLIAGHDTGAAHA